MQIASGDVDGDGFDDLVAVQARPKAGAAGSRVEILLGSSAYNPILSAGRYAPPRPRVLSFTAFAGQVRGPLSLAVRDLDGDGYAEIVLALACFDSKRKTFPLQVWSRSAGTFKTLGGLKLPRGLHVSHGYSLALGDLQGDGQVELLLGDLQGSNLFIGSVKPSGFRQLQFASTATVQPYGKNAKSGVRPSVVSAQQTLIRRPATFNSNRLRSALALPAGAASLPSNPLLGSLGTPGALIVQQADGGTPAQLPFGPGFGAGSLTPIAWSGGKAPVFASGGVSYAPSSGTTAVDGSPRPVLVAVGQNGSEVQLLAGPAIDATSGSWTGISTSANSLDLQASGQQRGWSNNWNQASSASSSAANRNKYGLVNTALVSYTTPFNINLNPLRLKSPTSLTSDLGAHLSSYTNQAVTLWNGSEFGSDSTPFGPGVPNSLAAPYNKGNASLPSFKPSFSLAKSSACVGNEFKVRQFQQRLINAAFTSLGINYQHHYSSTWYSPLSWSSSDSPTPQKRYQPSPLGRQSQGLDCTNFTSWNYNLAFGFWVDSGTAEQAQQTQVSLGRWTSGTPPVLKAKPVATARDIYLNADKSKRSSEQIMAYLEETLRPGDILYLGSLDGGHDVITNPGRASLANATHAITWINDCSADSPLAFVTLPAGAGSGDPTPFVIDSTGSESFNNLGQAYPNGVQVREFTSKIWYFSDILGVSRWLTPTNVESLAQQL